MLKEGMFIQERYEIIGRVGSGGMADVYKAKDHKLNRFVAVKVLKQEFREDKAFISKFRVEAQSAAGLAHPNIVNVYDVGEDHGISYIVMELVEGISLKEYIDKRGRLAVREATSIALQISMGLEAAHRNGIVHRDVKPQNVIISTDGKVKVTDFGIARAASSNTINSSVMGSVHYSSPEQARGGYSDYKSDIYSLGISMFEMLTGVVPFDGDSTVAIAIKHLQEELPSPRRYVPELPKSTVQIIYKCTQKSPDRRYGSLTELIRDLKESLVNPEGDFVQLPVVNNTARTVVITNDELNQIKQSYGETSVQGMMQQQAPPQMQQQVPPQQMQQIPPQQMQQQAPPQGINGYGNYGGYQEGLKVYNTANTSQKRGKNNQRYLDMEDDGEDINPKLEKFLKIGSIIIGVIILGIFVALANAMGWFDFGKWNLGGPSVTSTEQVTENDTEAGSSEVSTEAVQLMVEVPEIVGKTEAEAAAALNERNIGGVKNGEKASAEFAAGQIISQNPIAGSMVDKNTTVTYVISVGVEAVTIPPVANLHIDEVKAAFDEVGLKYNVRYYKNTYVEENHVVYAQPEAGSTAKTGDVIDLWVNGDGEDTSASSGKNVRSYIGIHMVDAQSELTALGMMVSLTEKNSSEYAAGIVISQDIVGENIAEGTTINLVVSLGAVEAETISRLEETEEAQETEEKVEMTTEASGAYKCIASLQAPAGYNGEPIRLSIEQDGKTTVLVDGKALEFPYSVNFNSDSNSYATIYAYVLDPNSGEVREQYEYQNVPFK